MTSRLTILLVEHDLGEIKNVLDALDPGPRRDRVSVVQDSTSALEFIEAHRGDQEGRLGLILLDLDLPNNGCFTILDAMRGDRELRGIPVVIMTSSCASPRVIEAYSQGAHSCVEKPFELEAFHAAARGIEAYWHSLYPVAD